MRLPALLLFATSAVAQTAVVRPKLIDTVLVNPGMGIQTFQRFNGDPLNPGVGWSEEGPTGPVTQGERRSFPPTTISYCRWFWETLEPEQGKVRWEILDRALVEADKHGQRLAIRLMPYDQKHPLPEWYRNSGAKRANAADQKLWEPDFSDPLFLKHWGDLVRAAGKRYDGDPRLDTVDISSIGYWGEGWSTYMPAFDHQRKLTDIWFESFPSTPLLMNFDEPEALHYGTAKGAGWRFDCLGDMREKWSHMLDFYPEQIVRAGIQDVWQRSPVSMETCGVPGGWFKHGWNVDYILKEALRWHVTSLNVKSSAIPPEWQARFDEFQKRMGYRFELRRIEYPTSVRAGNDAPFKMWWVNSGVAPVYRPYIVALAIAGETVNVTTDVRKWLPGDIVVEQPLRIPELAPGTYRLSTAILDPQTRKPAIQLGIAGRTDSGWYDLGEITVVR